MGKSPLNRLKKFDISRKAAGKKPIFGDKSKEKSSEDKKRLNKEDVNKHSLNRAKRIIFGS